MNSKKRFAILLLFLVLWSFIIPTINSTYAKTNSNYATGENNFTIDEGNADNKLSKNTFLGLLGTGVWGIAWCFEMLVRGVCALLTTSWDNLIFPWADRVIFNTMALLDINFINPSPNSLFMDGNNKFTAIGNAIRNIYFTGLSIALGLLGIVVAIMAIKIAISTIASEKAKYKEAIVDWLMALILLFGMHFIISFVFYLNETLVEVASGMVNKLIDTNNVSVDGISINSDNDVAVIEQMGDYFSNKAIENVTGVFSLGKANFTAAVLYAVFVVQSIIIFWQYFKRFFYVIILAIIAPFVVIYDFLKKAVL